ncbi:tyrosine-type recombinase/integrase [Caulobacter sp. BE254]|uniref:tyrosine-type recombinase/integrase n=1 Tax=Caulobacter sp. BE254 TaxID=2817720 RepID=UPI002863D541|nr:tyrosine-type recombinase/integrase [Caulobacter sp. BE254]MDR7114466.1 integrase [Caulobacter sp. BE254]
MVWPVVRLHVRPCGERIPILIDRDAGVPLLLPTIYVITALRSRAANTIAQHLIGVQVLLLWCHAEGISLDDRINSGTLFRGHEVDGLWDATARPIADLGEMISASNRCSRNVVKLGRKPAGLARDTVGNRRGAVRRYLAWLSERRLFALGHQPDAQQAYRTARDELLRSLVARSTSLGRRCETRHGLDDDERNTLLDAINPVSDANPWKGQAVRQRNLLMITLLLQLGLRRGELLALRVEDVDLQKGQVRLIRRPDNSRDSRRRQPVLKTQGRLLDLRSNVVDLLSTYILRVRAEAPSRAMRHGFLFVNLRTGAELSASTIENIFHQLRKLPGLAYLKRLGKQMPGAPSVYYLENVGQSGEGEFVQFPSSSTLMNGVPIVLDTWRVLGTIF